MGAAAGADLPGTATKRLQLVSHCRRVRAQTLSWILTVGCTLNRNEPIRFNLSFQTWGRIGTRYRYAQQRDMRGGSSILKEPRERERSLLL